MKKIYTKTGDRGTTSLIGGTRILKNDIRVEAYGSVDEVCSYIGTVIPRIKHKEVRIKRSLIEIQKDLFCIEAILSEPGKTQFPQSLERIQKQLPTLEKDIDTMTEQMPQLTHFILPGGGEIGASLHFARTLTRRAERAIIGLKEKESVEDSVVKYMNRLSDYLFTVSRYANFLENKTETTWSRNG